MFVVSLSSSDKLLGLVPRLGHERFLPNPFQYFNHHIILLLMVSAVKAPLHKQQEMKKNLPSV
jgi:p-aminobenzoyl-glutamate transporter AbgT